MAPTPNSGVFLDFAHPFLTEVDFNQLRPELDWESERVLLKSQFSNLRVRHLLTCGHVFTIHSKRAWLPCLKIIDIP